MIATKSRIDGNMRVFADIKEYKNWCGISITRGTHDVSYLSLLEVYDVKTGEECTTDNRMNMTDFYLQFENKVDDICDAPITDSIFNELHPAMVSSSIINNWVHRLGLLLDEKIPLRNGLSNTHRIEIAVKNYAKS